MTAAGGEEPSLPAGREPGCPVPPRVTPHPAFLQGPSTEPSLPQQSPSLGGTVPPSRPLRPGAPVLPAEPQALPSRASLLPKRDPAG